MDKSTYIPGAKEYTATPVQAKDMLVQDRKTGEYYSPAEAFNRLMNKPEIQAVFKRLAVR